MSVAKKVERMVAGLEKKTNQLEVKCHGLEAQNKQLTDEFVKGREEAAELKKRLKRVEVENAKLKQQLAQALQQQKGGVGGNLEDPVDGVEGQGQGFENGDGGKNPLCVFPEEIWTMIFGYLKEPRDLKSLYQTCTKFMWMLQDQRKNFLFVDVLSVFKDHAENILQPTYRYQCSKWMTLANCRLVCYSWKQCIDTFLQEHSPISPQGPVSKYSDESPRMLFSFPKNPWNNLTLRNLQDPEKNPIPSRYLRYTDNFRFGSTLQEKKAFQAEFLAFLRKFGSHVWYFRVGLNAEEHDKSQATCYTSLVTWLRLMPNLKALYLNLTKMNFANKAKLNLVNKALAQHPFPTMRTLKTLTFDECPPPLIQSILNANSHVEGLKIEWPYCSDYKKLELSLQQFKLNSLQDLCLDRMDLYITEVYSWKLQKLSLESNNISWTSLFQILEKNFAGTLAELNLAKSACGLGVSDRLNLPNLRVLNLKLVRFFKPLDFILPLVNLEYFKVDLTEMYQDRDKWEKVLDNGYIPLAQIQEIVKFHQYTHDLKNSNIWKLLPKLKKVMARTDRGQGYYGDSKDDKTTPKVNYNWQTCTRGQVDI